MSLRLPIIMSSMYITSPAPIPAAASSSTATVVTAVQSMLAGVLPPVAVLKSNPYLFQPCTRSVFAYSCSTVYVPSPMRILSAAAVSTLVTSEIYIHTHSPAVASQSATPVGVPVISVRSSMLPPSFAFVWTPVIMLFASPVAKTVFKEETPIL